ncbi:MAG TPA: bifunctional phosphoribosylaminoimidazolecarboxamide formyltransferase/IMP cyclohydrolase [Candidatus Gastranaerophilales bacterium]|nr:bifunctional phosphoribosylaminoimidazolecarboxamide formyltransferase/IMP cyclohydrolase [Candidatus Gastranaerophilales bacterium]
MAEKKAFISVYNKDGIVEFAQKIQKFYGYEIISTGGTYDKLKENGIKVTEISEITGFRELLGGRVKSLHPKIHAGILASRTSPDEVAEMKGNSIDFIDMVVVNLYPFEEASKNEKMKIDELYEYIDIGGVTLLRAAAKNFFDVTCIYSSCLYDKILQELDENNGNTTYELRKELAVKTFRYTSSYDAVISEQMEKRLFEEDELEILPDKFVLNLEKIKNLRYGENPHQSAAIYKKSSTLDYEVLQGKEISYNNMVDITAAVNIVTEFIDVPAACIIKHNNPCGVALGTDITDAYLKAHGCDPISAFGGIIGLNDIVTKEIANHAVKLFLEVIVAPDFSEEALEILSAKKNLRLVKLPFKAADFKKAQIYTIKDLSFGTLIQTADTAQLSEDNFKVATSCKPTKEQVEDMVFAWKVAKYVGSNAIVIAKDLKTLGIGMGQTSRIASMEIAIKHACDETKDAVIASDGFFPAVDSIHAAAHARIGAIIQPGGSIKDEEVIAESQKYSIPMIMTGIRHFKH